MHNTDGSLGVAFIFGFALMGVLAGVGANPKNPPPPPPEIPPVVALAPAPASSLEADMDEDEEFVRTPDYTYWQSPGCCAGDGGYGWDCPNERWARCWITGAFLGNCTDVWGNTWTELIGPSGPPRIVNGVKQYMQPYRPWV